MAENSTLWLQPPPPLPPAASVQVPLSVRPTWINIYYNLRYNFKQSKDRFGGGAAWCNSGNIYICLLVIWSPNWQELFVLGKILSLQAVMQECCMWKLYSLKCRIKSVVEILINRIFSIFSGAPLPAAPGSFPGSHLVRQDVWWDFSSNRHSCD